MGRSVGTTAAVGVCSVALLACGGGDSPRQPSAGARDPLDLAVVAVDARIGDAEAHASGVVIDADGGLVVTAAHAVWGARSLKVTTALGLLHGRIVARAPCADLAVVAVEPRLPGLAALARAPGGTPGSGRLLRAVGRRRADQDAAAYGMAALPVRATGRTGGQSLGPHLPAQPAAIALDTELPAALTGGPVVDAAGRLVGLALAADGSPRGMLVPWDRVKAQLDRLRAGTRAVYAGWGDQYRCAPAQHAYARAEYPGYRPADARLNGFTHATRVPGTEGLDERGG